jgi:hypothetical protein
VIRLEEVLENTGFRLHVPKDLPPTPLPNSEEVRPASGRNRPQEYLFGRKFVKERGLTRLFFVIHSVL